MSTMDADHTNRLEPKLVTVFREGYTRNDFFADLTAGITVGIVALPLAIAFAIASGVKPEQGLYTAIIAGMVIALLSGSRVQVSGPTGAFVVVVYAIVVRYGYNGLVIATFLAGVFLLLMGIFKMGMLVRFIPFPVITGFTAGIAVIIFSSQLGDFFGLTLPEAPENMVARYQLYFHHVKTINPEAVLVGLISLGIILLFPRIHGKIPGSLVAILCVTPFVYFAHLDVPTIGSRFGAVPNEFPLPQVPHITWQLVIDMFSPAITIAALAAIESLLAATVADGMTGNRHRSNMELVAQGAGNVASALFGGIPATGAIARTATNIKSGGRTPVSAIVHSLTLLLIMLAFGSYAALIPMPTLAAILIVVAYNMSEWRTFAKILRFPRSDIGILIATFLLTVFVGLTVAIEVGMIMGAFLFLRRLAGMTQVNVVSDRVKEIEEPFEQSIAKRLVPGIDVFEIQGSLFFAAIEQFRSAMRRINSTPEVLIIDLKGVPAIDASGLIELEDVHKAISKKKKKLLLCGIRPDAYETMKEAGLISLIGEEHIFSDVDGAIAYAKNLTT